MTFRARTCVLLLPLGFACSPAAEQPVRHTAREHATARSAPAAPSPSGPGAAPTSPAGTAPPELPRSNASAPGTEDKASPPGARVVYIGLHIGGGPNDAESKRPFEAAIRAHHADLVACFSHATPRRAGTFGVDLRIPREGGQPKVSPPRTSLQGEAFRECVLHAFQQVQFVAPLRGATVISYSVRFEPE